MSLLACKKNHYRQDFSFLFLFENQEKSCKKLFSTANMIDTLEVKQDISMFYFRESVQSEDLDHSCRFLPRDIYL